MALGSGYVYCGFERIFCEFDKNDLFSLQERNQKLNQVTHQL